MGLALLLASCQDPEYVSIDTSRQGITSLTATFTDGQYAESDAVVWNISAEDYAKDRFVIPVPWFFPETSDNPTEDNMKAMKVRAEMNNNFVLTPALGTLNLNEENWFTLTGPDGSSRQICITGERTKSAACDMISFSLVSPAVTGIINNTNNTISLISADDLSACLANFQVSAHATISPDPSTTELNYNEPVELTVTAHNGIDSRTYTVTKSVPGKIPQGFNSESLELLFNVDATNIVSIPWLATNAPSLGAIGNSLVVCMGDGTTPFYLNRITGAREGEINLGSATAASITSDEGEHLLICNHAEGGQTFEIYTTSSVTETPTLLTSFSNSSSLPMGYEMKVIGNIETNATIIVTNEEFTLPKDFDFKFRCGGGRLGAYKGSNVEKYVIRFTGYAKEWIKHHKWADDQEITEDESSTTITFSSTQDDKVFQLILSWGAQAEPLAPQKLVDRWKTEITALYHKIQK